MATSAGEPECLGKRTAERPLYSIILLTTKKRGPVQDHLQSCSLKDLVSHIHRIRIGCDPHQPQSGLWWFDQGGGGKHRFPIENMQNSGLGIYLEVKSPARVFFGIHFGVI